MSVRSVTFAARIREATKELSISSKRKVLKDVESEINFKSPKLVNKKRDKLTYFN